MGVLRAPLVASLILLLCLAASAPLGSGPVPGRVVTHTANPAFVHGSDGREIDRVAASIVVELRRYWQRAYPEHFGTPWRDLDGGYFAVDTTRTPSSSPPCSGGVDDVEGNAYYCPTVDAVAWDSAALLPVLREHYGEGAVTVVLAHEMGHAVQQRAGAESAGTRAEAVADCYAGSFLRWVASGRTELLRWDARAHDSALRALTVFRDPAGARSAGSPHGSAFGRVSAFQAGFDRGLHGCSEATDPRRLPATHGPERQRPLAEVVRSPGLRAFFADLTLGGAPRPDDVDRRLLRAVHRDLGDQAAATVLASRYALAAEGASGRPTRGRAVQTRITCLTGAYTASSADGRPSPGDLDAAVAVLLDTDRVSVDSSGTTVLTGSDRVQAFRAGVLGGIDSCGR